MDAKQPPVDTERVLRELLARIVNARDLTDVVIAAGIALEDLAAE